MSGGGRKSGPDGPRSGSGETSPDDGRRAGEGLSRRTLKGVVWTLTGAAASNLVRLAVLAVLARLLTPADFGLVAAAMTTIFFARMLKDVGVGQALVQRREIETEHIRTSFAFSTLLGASMALGLLLCAPAVAAFFGMPKAGPLIRVLSAMFALRGLSTTSNFLCQRDLQFRPLATIDFCAYVVGSALAVALAWLGLGPWALVYGYTAEALVSTLLLLWVRPPAIGLWPRWRHLRELLSYGAGYTLGRISNYFAVQGDYIVVGRTLGSVDLGFYTRAYELVRFPATVFTMVVGSVLFSALSKIHDDPERLGRVYRHTLFANALLLIPTSVGVILLAPEFIWLLMGRGWEDAVLPFQIMAVTMLARTSYKLGGIVGRSSGEVFYIAGLQAIYAIAVIGGASLSSRWGIQGVACTTALAVTIHYGTMSRLGLSQTNLGWSDFFAAHGPGALAGLAVLAFVLPVSAIGHRLALHSLGVLALGAVAGLAGFLLVAVLGLRSRRPDWVWFKELALGVLGRASGRFRRTERQEA